MVGSVGASTEECVGSSALGENARHNVKNLADIESVDSRDCDQVQSV